MCTLSETPIERASPRRLAAQVPAWLGVACAERGWERQAPGADRRVGGAERDQAPPGLSGRLEAPLGAKSTLVVPAGSIQ
jgi:hypothetical protein